MVNQDVGDLNFFFFFFFGLYIPRKFDGPTRWLTKCWLQSRANVLWVSGFLLYVALWLVFFFLSLLGLLSLFQLDVVSFCFSRI